VEKTDAQLAHDASRGDSAAFGVLVQRYRAALVGYVAGLIRARDDAEDLAQEAFLRAWQQAPLLREPATVGRWLYRIAHNLAISHIRRPRPVPLVVEPAEPAQRAEATDCEDRFAAVLAAIGQLGESHRQVIARKHFGGCTVDQVAAQLGVPPGTVRSRLGRAYAELRQLLAQELIQD